ncbi:MAG: hypothetical protein K0U52_01820 [Gammaproteobacteria bacterium]|jgi:hypothetical protein|nr:hypothetical protein [Gammaproteobacteria bacterium]
MAEHAKHMEKVCREIDGPGSQKSATDHQRMVKWLIDNIEMNSRQQTAPFLWKKLGNGEVSPLI